MHLIVVCLLYLLFRKFISPGVALFSALVFLIHPLNVESVSYIAQSASPLLTLLGLIALFFLTRKNLTWKILLIGFLLLVLSLLAKETGIVFLFLLLLYSFIFMRKNILKLLTGTCFTLLVYLFFRLYVGQIGLSKRLLAPIASLSLPERLLNIPLIMFYYFKNFFFPGTLAIDQQWVISSVNFTTFYFPLIFDTLFFIFLAVFGLYILKHQKRYFKPYLFFFGWFMAGVFFLLQIYPIDATVADRWFYLPMAGLIGMLAILIQASIYKITRYRAVIVLLVVVMLFSLFLRTIIRNTDWYDPVTLFSHDVQYNDNYDIEMDLGNEYSSSHKYGLALKYFQKSVELLPNDTNIYDLGYTYDQLGNKLLARKYYLEVINNKSSRSLARENSYQKLGLMMVQHDKPEITKDLIKSGLQDFSGDGSLWVLLAITEYRLYDQKDALISASKAETLLPNDTTSYIYTQIFNNQPIHLNY